MLTRLMRFQGMIRPSVYCFASEIQPVKQEKKSERPSTIQQYQNGQLVTRNSLVLKKKEDIEGYVFSVIKNYYRTTNRSNITVESTLSEHGLDSLDSIEISMQIEEDLGYVISAETLPVLNKVKHYINYINQVEQFKVQAQKDPLA